MKPVQGERNSPRPSSKVIKKPVSAMLLCNNAFGSSNMMEKEIKCISTCEQPCTTATLVERNWGDFEGDFGGDFGCSFGSSHLLIVPLS